jgi:hypothetical protein
MPGKDDKVTGLIDPIALTVCGVIDAYATRMKQDKTQQPPMSATFTLESRLLATVSK